MPPSRVTAQVRQQEQPSGQQPNLFRAGPGPSVPPGNAANGSGGIGSGGIGSVVAAQQQLPAQYQQQQQQQRPPQYQRQPVPAASALQAAWGSGVQVHAAIGSAAASPAAGAWHARSPTPPQAPQHQHQQQRAPDGAGGGTITASAGTSSNAVLVSRRQNGNPMLRHIRNVRWQFADATADYVVGASTAWARPPRYYLSALGVGGSKVFTDGHDRLHARAQIGSSIHLPSTRAKRPPAATHTRPLTKQQLRAPPTRNSPHFPVAHPPHATLHTFPSRTLHTGTTCCTQSTSCAESRSSCAPGVCSLCSATWMSSRWSSHWERCARPGVDKFTP
eukprot:364905-Chlamydomonas_euryale.AAC.15